MFLWQLIIKYTELKIKGYCIIVGCYKIIFTQKYPTGNKYL